MGEKGSGTDAETHSNARPRQCRGEGEEGKEGKEERGLDIPIRRSFMILLQTPCMISSSYGERHRCSNQVQGESGEIGRGVLSSGLIFRKGRGKFEGYRSKAVKDHFVKEYNLIREARHQSGSIVSRANGERVLKRQFCGSSAVQCRG
jgi:hypothetical protein